MAAIIEYVGSRKTTVSVSNPSVDLLYKVAGTEDDAVVKALVLATIPSTYADVVFQDFTIDHEGGGVWDVSVRYGKYAPVERPAPPPVEAGSSIYNFDTGGGTKHIVQSIQTVISRAASGNAPDFKGAIGVNGDTVEGTDVVIPQFNFSETHYFTAAQITTAYKLALFNLTGTVNDAAWKGLAKGEALFMGASGSKRGADLWEITYRFSGSPNAEGLTIGDMVDINKEGWEYLWVRYADAVDEDTLVKQPVAAFVEQVYEYGDFSLLGIGV